MKFCSSLSIIGLLCTLLIASERTQAKRIGENTNNDLKENQDDSAHRLLQPSLLFELPNVLSLYIMALCFSSHTTAEVKGRGQVPMSEIQVGDQVLTSNGDFETVYAMAHRHPSRTAKFLQIHSNNDSPLELTERHMLYLDGSENPVAASSVKVGDVLQSISGPREVTEISEVTRNGIYNPLTTGGTIVASEIISSSYSAFFSNDEYIKVGGYEIMTHQDFFHKGLKPFRYVCTGVSLELCKTSNEKFAPVQFASDVAEFMLQQNEIFQVILFFMVLSIVLTLDVIFSPYALVLAVAVAMVSLKGSSFLGRNSGKSSKKSKIF